MILILFAVISAVYSTEAVTHVSSYDDGDGLCTTYSYVTEERQNYDDARSWCAENFPDVPTDLAVIDTVAKYKHVRNYMKTWVKQKPKSPYTGFWVGCDDKGTEGDFKWLNGAGSSYTRWANGQPNNNNDGDGQDCVQIWVNRLKNKHLFYDDNDCSRRREFICSSTEPCT